LLADVACCAGGVPTFAFGSNALRQLGFDSRV
jgi:hypothetical protein